jgi:DNA-binding NtrC family response regulator
MTMATEKPSQSMENDHFGLFRMNASPLGSPSEVGQSFLANTDTPASLIDRAEAIDLLVEFCCREKPICLKNLIETIEMSLLLKILHQVHGNQKRAAKLLGIKYTTLNEKVKRYGIRFKKTPVPYAF